jgi:hypothetical protein
MLGMHKMCIFLDLFHLCFEVPNYLKRVVGTSITGLEIRGGGKGGGERGGGERGGGEGG